IAGLDPFIDLLFQVVLKLFRKLPLGSGSENCGAKDNAKARQPTEHVISPRLKRRARFPRSLRTIAPSSQPLPQAFCVQRASASNTLRGDSYPTCPIPT